MVVEHLAMIALVVSRQPVLMFLQLCLLFIKNLSQLQLAILMRKTKIVH